MHLRGLHMMLKRHEWFISCWRFALLQRTRTNQKRSGAKATKKLEQLEPVGHELNHKEAAVFRVLSARANDLAQDRVDIAYNSKELCRKFAVPNK